MKTCVECGAEFGRPRWASGERWARRRFCGHPCYWANRREREPVVRLKRTAEVFDWGQVLPFWRELLAVHDRVMQAPRRAR